MLNLRFHIPIQCQMSSLKEKKKKNYLGNEIKKKNMYT